MKNSKDFAYAMASMKILSWPLGTWPLQANVYSLIRFIVAIFFLLILLVLVTAELFLDRTGSEINFDALMLCLCSVLALSKTISFRMYFRSLVSNFVSALKDYDELDDETKRTIMLRHARMGRLASTSIVLFSQFCVIGYISLPILTSNYQDENATVIKTMYPVPSEHFINLLRLPEYLYPFIFCGESIFVATLAAGNLALTSSIGSDSLFYGIAFHLCGQVEVLKTECTKLTDESKQVTGNFVLLTNRHDYLLKLSGMLNDTISTYLVVQLFCSSVLICTGGFQFILALAAGNIVVVVKSFVILTTLLIQLLGYSYVGDYLKRQMDGVGHSLYSCGWYTLPRNLAKDIIFVIMKSQEPVNLTAGRFFVVNMETYMSILKTSMSYLSVLRVMI